jgi:hypothetical protein
VPSAEIQTETLPKIHTVAVRSDQWNSLGATRDPLLLNDGDIPNSASPPEPSTLVTPPVTPNAPLSIVLGAERGTAPSSPPRAQTSVGSRSGEPESVASVSALRPALNAGNVARATPGVGYAVQLTSQRSSASARAAFRALQTKFPSQLNGRYCPNSERFVLICGSVCPNLPKHSFTGTGPFWQWPRPPRMKEPSGL